MKKKTKLKIYEIILMSKLLKNNPKFKQRNVPTSINI